MFALQVRELGTGAFGTAQLMRDRTSGELVAVKYIQLRDVSRSGGAAGCCRYDVRALLLPHVQRCSVHSQA